MVRGGGLRSPVVQPAREYGPGLAVVVAGPGGDEDVAGCLASLDGPERVLVTAGRTPRRVDGALDLGEDLPRPAAVNRAVAALDPDVGWVLVTEPQVRWAPGALVELRAAADRRPRAGLLAPRHDGPPPAALPGRWAGDGLLRALAPALARAPVPARDEPVAGHAVLLRRAALDSVGGYDATLPTEVADLDLADRIRRAGWLVVRVPAAAAAGRPGDGPETAAERHRGTRRYLAGRHRGARGAVLAVALAARSRAVRG